MQLNCVKYNNLFLSEFLILISVKVPVKFVNYGIMEITR